ncbi:MAG: uL15 family ribosomal protein [Anaplasmataceae bacterium]|nr:uL15 family ribosomal protein [Anaplasmataceae bacterium]
MKLHELYKTKSKKQRVARGGSRGTTGGRGQKGQKSRAGHKIRPAVRDLISRLPKLRGIKHKPVGSPTLILNLRDIAKLSGMIDLGALKEAGVVNRRYKGSVKILSKGEAPKKATFKGLKFSSQARTKVLEAGATIE